MNPVPSGCGGGSVFFVSTEKIISFDDNNDTDNKDLRTFALIVSAHPYCARKFTCHVMHERAR